jgi:ATP-binding cassette subfamily G (WHITE) protein 2 (PDR)
MFSIIAFLSWYFPIGFQNDIQDTREAHERAGLMCALVWVFYLFTSTFATAIVAAVEHVETAVNLAQLFYQLSLIFCG